MKSRKAGAVACRSGDAETLVKKSHRGPESKVASNNDFAEKGVRGQACPQPKHQALRSSSHISLALLLTSATKVSPLEPSELE